MSDIIVPFNKPHIVGKELYYIAQAVLSGKISGDGAFSNKCSKFMQEKYKIKKVLLTTSCSTALDMSAILIDIKPGDEVILPSFTFTSTANSFLIRGAKLKFVDIRKDTLNIDENKIKGAITARTKAIVVVHYAGVACDMDKIMEIAKINKLFVIEDAAHAMESKYKEKYLGTIADIGCYSFHETKNVTSGEGGAILMNNEKFSERAEIIREKGTNRSKFFRGEIDKYTWVDIGSSYLPSEILAAFLYAQLENIDIITKKRLSDWQYYYDNLEDLEKKCLIRRPIITDYCIQNGHLFYILLNNSNTRDLLIDYLNSNGISAVFHYIPLHSSPMGEKMGYKRGQLPITEELSSRLLRLPLFYGLSRVQQDMVLDNLINFFSKHS